MRIVLPHGQSVSRAIFLFFFLFLFFLLPALTAAQEFLTSHCHGRVQLPNRRRIRKFPGQGKKKIVYVRPLRRFP